MSFGDAFACNLIPLCSHQQRQQNTLKSAAYVKRLVECGMRLRHSCTYVLWGQRYVRRLEACMESDGALVVSRALWLDSIR